MKAKKKSAIYRVFRTAIQIAFLLLLVGLFASTFQGIKIIAETLIAGNIDLLFWQRLFSTGLMLLSVILLGRIFCGFMCGFSAVGDWFSLAGEKVFKVNGKPGEKLDGILKYLKYLVLLAIIGIIWIGNLTFFNTWDPWMAFGAIWALPPDFQFVISNAVIGAILFVIFMVGSLFIERFFCRYFCPLGAIYSIISKLSFGKIYKPREKCGSCRVCSDKCSMGINLSKYDTVKSGECIFCMNCINYCPRSNARYTLFKKKASPYIAGIFALLLLGAWLCKLKMKNEGQSPG
ncbi:MAG: 4Fe-4S binding protein [Anaerovoracaceae bacterium]